MVDTIQNILIILLFILHFLDIGESRVIHTEMTPKEFKEFLAERFKDEDNE